MTNREKYFLKRDEYDLMMTMKKNLERIGVFCPIDVITGKKPECKTVDKPSMDGTAWALCRDCKTCVQEFLNEKYKER